MNKKRILSILMLGSLLTSNISQSFFWNFLISKTDADTKLITTTKTGIIKTMKSLKNFNKIFLTTIAISIVGMLIYRLLKKSTNNTPKKLNNKNKSPKNLQKYALKEKSLTKFKKNKQDLLNKITIKINNKTIKDLPSDYSDCFSKLKLERRMLCDQITENDFVYLISKDL